MQRFWLECMWYSDPYFSSKHIFKKHRALAKNKRHFKVKTSTQVVGTSGSQKSCTVCFQGMTSQGTFKLG